MEINKISEFENKEFNFSFPNKKKPIFISPEILSISSPVSLMEKENNNNLIKYELLEKNNFNTEEKKLIFKRNEYHTFEPIKISKFYI